MTSPEHIAQGLPDLTGQPSWVVVVVIALVTAGSVGLAWIKRGERPKTEEPAAARPVDAQAVPSVSGTPPSDATQVIQSALEHLAAVAAREALESKEARAETTVSRAETAELRRDLLTCGTELNKALRRAESAEAELTRCRAQAELLGRQAFQRGAERDHG